MPLQACAVGQEYPVPHAQSSGHAWLALAPSVMPRALGMYSGLWAHAAASLRRWPKLTRPVPTHIPRTPGMWRGAGWGHRTVLWLHAGQEGLECPPWQMCCRFTTTVLEPWSGLHGFSLPFYSNPVLLVWLRFALSGSVQFMQQITYINVLWYPYGGDVKTLVWLSKGYIRFANPILQLCLISPTPKWCNVKNVWSLLKSAWLFLNCYSPGQLCIGQFWSILKQKLESRLLCSFPSQFTVHTPFLGSQFLLVKMVCEGILWRGLLLHNDLPIGQSNEF